MSHNNSDYIQRLNRKQRSHFKKLVVSFCTLYSNCITIIFQDNLEVALYVV